MTSTELLRYAQQLLDPPPEHPGHAESHDEACAWADQGHEREG